MWHTLHHYIYYTNTSTHSYPPPHTHTHAQSSPDASLSFLHTHTHAAVCVYDFQTDTETETDTDTDTDTDTSSFALNKAFETQFRSGEEMLDDYTHRHTLPFLLFAAMVAPDHRCTWYVCVCVYVCVRVYLLTALFFSSFFVSVPSLIWKKYTHTHTHTYTGSVVCVRRSLVPLARLLPS
jgi:hypothetical protein